MKNVNKLFALTVLSACTIAPFAAAEDAGSQQTYLGGGVGYSKVNGEDFTNVNGDISESQGSWKAIVGVKMSPMLSLEGQFIDFGAANRNTDHVKATAWTAGAVLNVFGENPISPYGKVSALFWETDNFFNNISMNQSGTDLALGIGVRFTFAGRLSLRTEYERFEMDNTQVDNVSAALLLTF